MVWLHGGAYMFGQGTERPWTVHENDSIVKVRGTSLRLDSI